MPAAALVFVALYLIGGDHRPARRCARRRRCSAGTLLIGIGEAIITALTVGAVIAIRPDLVYAAGACSPSLVLKTADGEVRRRAAPTHRGVRRRATGAAACSWPGWR